VQPRVLVISASIGSGHVAAGRALEHALRSAGAETHHVDLLDYTTLPFRRLYRQAYFDLVRTAPDFVDWLGKRLDRSPTEVKTRQARLRARLVRAVSYHLPRQIARVRPTLLVHTHFLGPEILSAQRRELTIPQTLVITDFFAHALWLRSSIRRYYVGAEEIAVHIRASGVDARRVRVTGIPIDPRFGALPSRAAARGQLELDPERDVLLFMAGGMEPKTVKALLTQALALRWPLQLVMVCGRSPDLVAVLRPLVAEADGLVRVRLLGFTGDIPTYMAAADLMAGKPGGLTSSEALAAGLPMAIVQPYPLQEEANATYLLEAGAAMRIEPLTTFSHKLQRYFADPERRAAMAAAAARLGRPHAARDVVDDLRAQGLL
jgi:processive 1,2-diacylglycerol beta-glucosyltransferase